MNWFRHAFALDPPGPAEPTEAERPVVERVCAEVVRRQLTTPALVFLGMSRPLNSLAAQAIYFFSPVLSVVLTGNEHHRFAEFLDRRGSVDYLCRRIERLARPDRLDPAESWRVTSPGNPLGDLQTPSSEESTNRRPT